MKYEGTFKCGHEGVVSVTGSHKERECRQEKMFSENLCPECYKLELESKNKEALELSQDQGLVELNGSEKQIGWANTLRLEMLETIKEYIAFIESDSGKAKRHLRYLKDYGVVRTISQLEDFLSSIKAIDSAKWFIDNRSYKSDALEIIYAIENR